MRLVFLQRDARRAEGCRFTVVDAEDGKTKLAKLLTQDAEAMFHGLPAGRNVLVSVTTRNATGESQPGGAVAAVVP